MSSAAPSPNPPYLPGPTPPLFFNRCVRRHVDGVDLGVNTKCPVPTERPRVTRPDAQYHFQTAAGPMSATRRGGVQRGLEPTSRENSEKTEQVTVSDTRRRPAPQRQRATARTSARTMLPDVAAS